MKKKLKKNNSKLDNKNRNQTLIICLISLIIIVILVIMAILLSSSEKEIELEYNTNESFLESQEVDNLSFTNISCSYDGSVSIISYVITNLTDDTYNLSEYSFVVKDKDGNVLATINPEFNYELSVGEEYYTSNSVNANLLDAYSIEIEIN